MLEVVRSAARRSVAAAGFDVEILSLATANPSFQLTQAEAASHARELADILDSQCGSADRPHPGGKCGARCGRRRSASIIGSNFNEPCWLEMGPLL